MTRVDVERAVRDAAATAPDEVLSVYLYGSHARGEATPRSDVDVGVLFRESPPRTLGGVAPGLEGLIERAVGVPVEVVVMNTAPSDLVHRILRDGILLLDRDRSARLRFEVQSRNEYFDLAPLRRLYRRLPA